MIVIGTKIMLSVTLFVSLILDENVSILTNELAANLVAPFLPRTVRIAPKTAFPQMTISSTKPAHLSAPLFV